MHRLPLNPKLERKRALTDFGRTLACNPFALLCLCCYSTWMILVFQSSALLPSTPFFGLELPGWLPPMTCMALASFALALVFWLKRFVIPTRALFASMGALMTGGAVCLVMWMANAFAIPPLYPLLLAGSTLAGTGTALLYIEMNRILGFLGMRKTGFLVIASMSTASLFASFLSFAPTSVKTPLIVLLPIATLLLYKKAIGAFPADEYFNHGVDVRLYFPWKYLVTSFLQGFALGIVGGSVVFLRASDLGVIPNAAGCILACALFLATITLFELDFNRLIYQIGFPLMALGFYLIGLLVPYAIVGGLVQIIGYYFVDLSM